MDYVVLDFEWNQSNNGKEPEAREIPFEIIDIGAVKLNSLREITKEYNQLVKPGVYHQMHKITGSLIHLHMKDLEKGRPFTEVIKEFLNWCGEGFIYCTWGPLDLYEMQRNMRYYHMEPLSHAPIRFLDVQKLFAIAYEIEAVGGYSQNIIRIQLAVGLPPAHYGAQCEMFTKYFTNRGAVKFEFKGRSYSIYIEKALCFPQSYAAASTILSSIRTIPKALILDLGGFTADYLRIQNGAGDLSVCDSLENGIISFYNKVISRISSDQDILLEESEIDAILEGKVGHVPPAVASAVEQQAQDFINDLFSTLRERGLELKSGVVVFVGGGSIRLRRQIEASGKVGKALFVDDIQANAKGFEKLYQYTVNGR